jgi:hypothetical protein
LLLHRSVEEYVKKGRYTFEDARFVDDAPLDVVGSDEDRKAAGVP